MEHGDAVAGHNDQARPGQALLRREWYPDGRLLAASNESSTSNLEYGCDGLVLRVLLTPPRQRGPINHGQSAKLDSAGRPREITDDRGLAVLMDYEQSGVCEQFQTVRKSSRGCRAEIAVLIPSRLHAAQAQHERHRMRRRGLKPVVLIELFGAIVERMHEQGSHPGVLRYGHCAVDSVLQQRCSQMLSLHPAVDRESGENHALQAKGNSRSPLS